MLIASSAVLAPKRRVTLRSWKTSGSSAPARVVDDGWIGLTPSWEAEPLRFTLTANSAVYGLVSAALRIGERPHGIDMRIFWFSLGLTALGLGVLGIAVPLLPTTPFLLLAAFAFARSSQRWHTWLIHHPFLGPVIQRWRDHGALSRTTKVASVLSMLLILGISMAAGAGPTVLTIQALVLSACAVFLLTRPEPPNEH